MKSLDFCADTHNTILTGPGTNGVSLDLHGQQQTDDLYLLLHFL